MIGVPMILLSLFLMTFNLRLAARLFFGGWFLQFIGHYIFEHNKPVVLEIRSRNLFLSAIIFAAHQWKRLLTGKHVVTS
jgi:uncharacterized membrane protein YGL010W